MLYSENRKSGKKGFYLLIVVCILFLLAGCDKGPSNPNVNITIEAFADLKTQNYILDSDKIRRNIMSLCKTGEEGGASERYIRDYYLNNGLFLWIERAGVDERADTLLNYLRSVDDMGFSTSAFCVDDISADLKRIRTLDFDDSVNTVNDVAARLEYNLTRGYVRYAAGQRFGFVNPQYLLNRLDTLDDFPMKNTKFRCLFDIKIERPGDGFFAGAMRKIYNDSIGPFLKQIQPDDTLYSLLGRELKSASQADCRLKVICNMERCRWREKERPEIKDKYIVVNIPAFHLYAFNGDSVMDMRVGCGSRKTKTPLLISVIERMEVNPIWNIPMSIIRKEVSLHAGDIDYFERNHYYIVKRETGERIEPEDVTADMLKSGEYRVSQEGGEGNSMGRIVFRFANNFSVFLHDTSSKSVFARSNRGISHGCVRVQRPFDLAVFLMTTPDEWLLDRLRISMDIKPETKRGLKYIEDESRNRKLVGSLPVKPPVPLFITYYTIYPDESGKLASYPDVYGYDEIIARNLKPFLN